MSLFYKLIISLMFFLLLIPYSLLTIVSFLILLVKIYFYLRDSKKLKNYVLNFDIRKPEKVRNRTRK